MNDLYEKAWKSVISPNKFTHTISSFCPKMQTIEGRKLERVDFTFFNPEGKMICCIILKQEGENPEHTILYMHGNGGSKLECLGFTSLICKNRLSVIAFDFVGCGNSDSGFLTYGINESKDAEQVLKESQKYCKLGKLTIWGRSMGAATSIMMAQKNKEIVHRLVLDCPFQKLSNVIKRVIKNQTSLPRFLVSLAFYFIEMEIKDKLKFELFNLDYLQLYSRVSKSLPTLCFYSANDLIVPKQQVFGFYETCKTSRELVQIFQNHEDERSLSVFDEGVQWVCKNMNKKGGKIKLSYMSDNLQIQKISIEPSQGFFCCSKT